VAVRDAVDVLPHASLALHVLVCEREQLLLVTEPSLTVNVVAPHPSDEVAVPSASVISEEAGLQPNVRVVPPVVIIGAVKSAIQVTVLDIVAVLLHASVTVYVLVCERSHPAL
jgi:hypothetical protein